jgi:hypothetical protein
VTRTRLLLTATLLVAATLAGCGDDDAQLADAGDTTTTEPTVPDGDGTSPTTAPEELACSGAGIMTTAEFPTDVPEATATTLIAIRSAAQSCDYDGLAGLALADGRFSADFQEMEDPDELAAYWRRVEEEGEPLTARIVHLTTMSRAEVPVTEPDGREIALHVAPRALHEDDDDARQEVLDVFGEEAEQWFADGQYLGWRMGVTGEGDWRFLVVGGD